MEYNNKLAGEIMREMLLAAFERIGDKIMAEHPQFTSDEVRQEAQRMTTIYMENYDLETNEFDLDMIQRMFGRKFATE